VDSESESESESKSPARDREVKVSFEPSAFALQAAQSFISLLFIYLTNGII